MFAFVKFAAVVAESGLSVAIVHIGAVGSPSFLLPTQPGIILRARWHPASEQHIFVLTSGGVLQIWDALDFSGKPEQEHILASGGEGAHLLFRFLFVSKC